MLKDLSLLEQQTRENEKRLEVLHALASEGFRQLDQGESIELHGRKELDDFIERIDRRARRANKKRRVKRA